MLNVRQIEVFKAVMECGSVSEAARRLNVSQPSVSKHLSLLEARLGMSLFLRTGNRLMPNSEAVALHQQVEQLYSGLTKLNSFMSDMAQHRHGEVQIAAMPLIAHRWLPEVVAPLLRRYTQMSASFPVRSSSWVSKWVAAGRADLGIAMPVNEDGVIAEPLMDLPMVAVLASDHPLAAPGPLTAGDLRGESLITLSTFDYSPSFFDDLLRPMIESSGRRIQTFTTYVACELARQGLGVALVDALTAMQFQQRGTGLCVRQLEENPTIRIALLSAAHWPRSALADQFMAEVRRRSAQTMRQIDDMLI
ncbi:LysR substrate-binding domain-containing protein [Gemmobacter sp.]|uniref:LysR substrate-binding domain-containing protein n=1 Tax=Gemmobacter sp. TaxID=1898957 RepID=UPI002AFF7628|nr:LysR substrate-binding domain-containing protein [Gemmobacter sp.]